MGGSEATSANAGSLTKCSCSATRLASLTDTRRCVASSGSAATCTLRATTPPRSSCRLGWTCAPLPGGLGTAGEGRRHYVSTPPGWASPTAAPRRSWETAHSTATAPREEVATVPPPFADLRSGAGCGGARGSWLLVQSLRSRWSRRSCSSVPPGSCSTWVRPVSVQPWRL